MILGKVSQNHPLYARGARDDVDDRATPRHIFAPLHHEFDFTIDVAASKRNAKLPRFYTRASNGLTHSWSGERVWCNPPYSAIEPWIVKAWRETARRCPLVVMLLPANRTEQPWWQNHIEPFRDRSLRMTTRFLRSRIKFIASGRVVQCRRRYAAPPFGNVLVIFRGGR